MAFKKLQTKIPKNGALGAVFASWFDIENAAPPTRYLYIAYVPLYFKQGNKITPIGSFIPELYELANAPMGSLQNQPPDKSPFELAVVPSLHEADIVKRVKQEYYYRRDHKLALPTPISKLRIIPDYLKNLPMVVDENDDTVQGLVLKQSSPPRGIYINLKNPPEKASTLEKILHFSAWWLAWLVTLSASFVIFGSPWAVALGAIVMYFAKITGNEFDMFDKAEALYRDLSWIFYMPWKSKAGFKFSLQNTFMTLCKLATLAIASYYAFMFMWEYLLTLSVGSVIAGFFSLIAGLSTFIGGAATQRYYWNLSFCDNQIAVPQESGQALLEVFQTFKTFTPAYAQKNEKPMFTKISMEPQASFKLNKISVS